MPAELERIRETIVKSLRRSHPEWNEKRIQDASWGIATDIYKKRKGGAK